MEHYYLIISDDFLIDEDFTIIKILQSLLPCSKEFINFSSDSVFSKLLNCKSIFISIFNKAFQEKESVWKQIDLNSNFKNSFLEEFKNEQLKQDIKTESIGEFLCSRINNLADLLPNLGSYKLDVLISYHVLKDLSLSKDIELSKALYRLYLWHGAYTTIIVPEKFDHCLLKDWCNIINYDIHQISSEPISSPILWRGSLKMQANEKNITYPGFQLRLHLPKIKIQDSTSVDYSDVNDVDLEHIIMSPHLNIIDVCSFSSIPPYLFLPVCFKLSISEPNYFNHVSKEFYDHMWDKNEVALIARMGYHSSFEKLKPDKMLSTTKWQKMISTGNIKCPDSALPSTDKYVTLVLSKCHLTGDIMARPLEDTSRVCPDVYFKASKFIHFKLPNSNVDLTKDGPDINLPIVGAKFLTDILHKNKFAKLNTSVKSDENHLNQGNDLKPVLESIAEEKEKISLTQNNIRMTCEEVDPADWPERVYLLQNQMKAEKEKKFLANAHPNFSPQVPKNQILFNCEDASKYFLASGLAKDSSSAEPLSPVSSRLRQTKTDFDTLSWTKWPELIKCVYDDLYYNSDSKAEERESVGNEMVRLYVQHETATSCNRQQLNPRSAILLGPRLKPRERQKWRSPRKQPRSSFADRMRSVEEDTNSKTLQPNGHNSTVKHARPTDQRHKLLPVEQHAKQLNRRLEKLAKNPSLPTRCNPRKKMPVSNAAASRSKSSTQRRPSINPTELSSQQSQDKSKGPQELAKKKLRVAVVSALEKNGIGLENPLFRRCFKRLFTVCQAFAQDIPKKKGSTSEQMQRIADAHVRQVIDFERSEGGC